MRTKKDIDPRISRVWIECPVCENNCPSFGNAPLCDECGYDDFGEFRDPDFHSQPVWTRGRVAEA